MSSPIGVDVSGQPKSALTDLIQSFGSLFAVCTELGASDWFGFPWGLCLGSEALETFTPEQSHRFLATLGRDPSDVWVDPQKHGLQSFHSGRLLFPSCFLESKILNPLNSSRLERCL